MPSMISRSARATWPRSDDAAGPPSACLARCPGSRHTPGETAARPTVDPRIVESTHRHRDGIVWLEHLLKVVGAPSPARLSKPPTTPPCHYGTVESVRLPRAHRLPASASHDRLAQVSAPRRSGSQTRRRRVAPRHHASRTLRLPAGSGVDELLGLVPHVGQRIDGGRSETSRGLLRSSSRRLRHLIDVSSGA
jgi:hypothetical protein